jgi:hypothetical protein
VDKSHNRPRISSYQNPLGGSATTQTNGGFGYVGMPLPSRDYGQDAPCATEQEFQIRAKQYKKSQLKSKLLKKLVILGIILGLIVVIAGSLGLALNHRYSGRALPYSYIGSISIGGLTAAEIQAALDTRASKTVVTFTEAGQTRQVPISEFEPKIDTQKAAQNAIVGFNPFNYLTKRNFTVPVEIDETQVDGYLRLNVANKQTPSNSAEIIKDSNDITIKPETYGFTTSSAYITQQIKEQLSQMQNPVVSLSAAYDRPQITAEDLKDDLENAKAMVATDVSLQVWNTKISPTVKEKLSWLDVKQISGTNNVNIEFNQAKVREYVFGIADKYTYEQEDEEIAVNERGGQYITQGKNGQKVKNIDRIASDFYTALKTKQSGLFALEFEYTEFAKIDRQSVNLITAPVAQEVNNTADEGLTLEETPTEDEAAADDTVSLNPAGNQRRN